MNTRHSHGALGPQKSRSRGPQPPFSTLYRSHYDFVWRCALRLGASSESVEDIVQETFVIALRRLEDFDPAASVQISTWLFGILRNVLRNHNRGERRRARRHAAVEELARAFPESEGSGPDRYLALSQLQAFIDGLGPKLRSVFVLAELEGHTSREIGRALKLPPGTVRTRLRVARSRFTAHFDERAPALRATLASEREHPPSCEPERVERGLALLLGPPILGPSGAGGGKLTAWLVSGSGKLTAALVVATLATVSLAAVGARDRAEQTPRRSSPPTSSPPASPAIAAAETSPAIAAAETSPAPSPTPDDSPPIQTAPPPAPRAKVAPPPEPSESAEPLRALTAARQHLLAGAPQRALDTLHAVPRWTSSALSAQALGLELGALCSLERGEQARARAQRWAQRHPDRPLDPRLHQLCWTAQPQH